jgi:hypothetical protein
MALSTLIDDDHLVWKQETLRVRIHAFTQYIHQQYASVVRQRASFRFRNRHV